MVSGAWRIGALLAAAALSCLIASGGVGAADAPAGTGAPGLGETMAALAAVRHIRASFREEKSLAILDRDLVSTGTMVYRADVGQEAAGLELAIESPERVSYGFSPDWIIIARSDAGEERVPLSADPPLRLFVHTVLATFAGDLATLQQHYRIQYESVPGSWLLRLVPVDPLIAGHLDSVVIHGRGNYAEIVERREVGGDRITTRFTPSLIE